MAEAGALVACDQDRPDPAERAVTVDPEIVAVPVAELARRLADALRDGGGERLGTNSVAALITAERLIRHLRRCGFVIARCPGRDEDNDLVATRQKA
jgi:hypothetical protein